MGGEFLNELEDVFTEIASNPDRYAKEFHDIHAGLLKRFPYVVFYRNKIDHIRVLAVFHASRNPDRWQSRN
ncbi:MAG: type II toxin-antitoxin system RelE/ParE family toxin [Planctomycetia bacterium]|nr:type II toxin-antitoxin system RelE/ParE family toxin [Planctomycetia bacterium]